MIPVDLGDGVPTSMPELQLFKRWGIEEDSRAQTHWVEYWLEAPVDNADRSKCVHRSVHVFVKKALDLGASEGSLNG